MIVTGHHLQCTISFLPFTNNHSIDHSEYVVSSDTKATEACGLSQQLRV